MIGEELSFFPRPYKDEDFRSVIKRYHCRSGNKFESISRKELFNNTTNTILPRNIDFLFKRLPRTFSIEETIFQNTLLPIIYLFFGRDKKKSLIEDIHYIKDSKHSSSMYLKEFVSENLRYCPVCKKNDIEKYGVFYARRIHQLIGFDFCIKHHNYLEYENHIKVSDITYQDILLLEPILKEIEYILNNDIFFDNNFDLSFKYIAAFFVKGYLTKEGKVKTDIFNNDLMKNFSTVFNKLGIDKKYLTTKNRIWKMAKLEHKKPNPFLHILMMNYLMGSTKEFLFDETISIVSNIPFGTGPWVCQNHLCEFFKQPVIKRCLRNFRKGSFPTARFECPSCGFIYVKNTFDGTEEFKITTFGRLWEKELVLKYKETMSLKETAIHCRVKNPTARKYLTKLSSEYFLKKSKNHYSKKHTEVMVETFKVTKSIRKSSELLGIDRKTLMKYIPNELIIKTNYHYKDTGEKTRVYKQKVIEGINSLENPLRTMVRELVGEEIYKFLMKEERNWMEKILPPKYINRRNWGDLDNELSQEIKEVANNIKGDLPKFRITKNRIKESISPSNKCLIQNNTEKLVKSIETLEQYKESMDDYQIRKLDYTINLLKKNHNKVTLATLKALPAYRETSAALERLIQDKLNNQ
ncbi:TnsD family Tn7-like transposition protein [Cytobacillus praedii]|uniref:TnsD family Tn7-like transposition protein n=1 Tax=Cytobacillus praedii TaxID=1742358 RepID=UPI00070DD7F0|nr:TnsD family Tn7-like transposition protein [Cytobacillus praedii]